jgi:phosphoglycolate phosphatase-like HAD superfamily hydrolase
MHKPKIAKIYVDMDGVLCDFEKRYTELFDISPKETRDNKSFNGYFDKFVDNSEFANLDWMPGAPEAVSYLNKLTVPIEILSSTASTERHDKIAPQKQLWLQTHNIGYKQNFVPGKQHKHKFATPDSIIIDDTESVIRDWNEAGGIGILHKDWPTTLAILKMYI